MMIVPSLPSFGIFSIDSPSFRLVFWLSLIGCASWMLRDMILSSIKPSCHWSVRLVSVRHCLVTLRLLHFWFLFLSIFIHDSLLILFPNVTDCSRFIKTLSYDLFWSFFDLLSYLLVGSLFWSLRFIHRWSVRLVHVHHSQVALRLLPWELLLSFLRDSLAICLSSVSKRHWLVTPRYDFIIRILSVLPWSFG